jgi:DNA-directed RNA polymerase I subunit RPA2
MDVRICWEVDGTTQSMMKRFSNLPIMVKSSKCHLNGLGPQELLDRKEEAQELGAYFITNGIERIIRLVIVNRRNHVMAIIRPSFANRGQSYTKLATTIRCVRNDQSSLTMTLHYLTSGSCMLRLTIKKQEFFLPAPLVLMALVNTTDRQIFESILRGNTGDVFAAERCELMIREAKRLGLHTRSEVLAYLGRHFRLVLTPEGNPTDEEAGKFLLDQFLFVHCTDNRQKFDVLCLMIRKLYALAQGVIQPDNPDALNCQEVLLPGHLYNMIIKEKLQDFLTSIKEQIKRDVRVTPDKVVLTSASYVKKCVDSQVDITKRVENFLLTGNIVSNTGLDLMQVSGYTVVADKLNFYRYISHFRSIHRGQFFTTMKTTTVRKLLPESWGFVCPAHTPDGAPCGLLNHLSHACQVLTHPCRTPAGPLVRLLAELGMTQTSVVVSHTHLPVVLDGVVVGYIAPLLAADFVRQLRTLKTRRHAAVPLVLEMTATFDYLDACFPGIFMATGPARFLRPVYNLAVAAEPVPAGQVGPGGKTGTLGYGVELIGAMEQVFMEIACTADDFRAGETTHMEISPVAMLSLLASLTPFCDFNQSPRNMYQCQMGKQTMGTPFHAFPHRIDNKVYRIQNPQTPLVQNQNYEHFNMNEYPLGCNAVVAVISYTGYDMEDAMIISKGSYERGWGHGSVYKHMKVNLVDDKARDAPKFRFSNLTTDPKTGEERLVAPSLDRDGLPRIGMRLAYGDPVYVVLNETTGRSRVVKHKDHEPCIVDSVRVLVDKHEKEPQRIGITFLYNRNPVIGDKFSSRHGQKGVLSVLWPQENMPFSETGMVPDVIINPHAFPSRMTIGMLVESLAGKSGSLFGNKNDGTPFRFNEKHRAVEYFGQQLVRAGYNYAGTEPLYSGTSGLELKAEIYIGVVYYQRLRHMVSDKSQVRATGPVNAITRQPIKGRKVHGGIRFGEMERDSLLAHGVTFLLHDRLMNCSDYSTASVCTTCGSLLSPYLQHSQQVTTASADSTSRTMCRVCNKANTCALVAIPFVFVYLINELAAMNMRLNMKIR